MATRYSGSHKPWLEHKTVNHIIWNSPLNSSQLWSCLLYIDVNWVVIFCREMTWKTYWAILALKISIVLAEVRTDGGGILERINTSSFSFIPDTVPKQPYDKSKVWCLEFQDWGACDVYYLIFIQAWCSPISVPLQDEMPTYFTSTTLKFEWP